VACHTPALPGAATSLHITGYDDDPREIYEFPEVTRYVRRFARAANIDFDLGCARLHPTSVGLLALCGAFGENLRQLGLRHAPRRSTTQ
jgi:hypothetical protein